MQIKKYQLREGKKSVFALLTTIFVCRRIKARTIKYIFSIQNFFLYLESMQKRERIEREKSLEKNMKFEATQMCNIIKICLIAKSFFFILIFQFYLFFFHLFCSVKFFFYSQPLVDRFHSGKKAKHEKKSNLNSIFLFIYLVEIGKIEWNIFACETKKIVLQHTKKRSIVNRGKRNLVVWSLMCKME